MADRFGFRSGEEVYRYRCQLAGTSDNGVCFAEFCERLGSFFHGEHPTRISWYRYQAVDESLQAARTVDTGNYVFNAEALDWFIPLRMSGSALGRLLRRAIGNRFVSANLPMLGLVRERLDLNLVAAQRLSQAELASIEASLRRDVDQRMRVAVKYLDDIPRTDAGKHRFVIGMADGPER